MAKKAGPTVFFLLMILLMLAACQFLSPQPTPTPLPPPTATATALPTASPTANPTATPIPSPTTEPTPTPAAAGLPMPVGTPLTDWEGMPIMPGALAGQGDSDGYLFTIKASAKEIQAFYEAALQDLGWSLLGVGEGETKNVLLIFQKGDGSFSIAIIDPQAEEGLLQVLLVK